MPTEQEMCTVRGLAPALPPDRSAGVDWERRELTGEALVEAPPFLLPNELLRTAPPAAAFFRPGTMDMARANSPESGSSPPSSSRIELLSGGASVSAVGNVKIVLRCALFV